MLLNPECTWFRLILITVILRTFLISEVGGRTLAISYAYPLLNLLYSLCYSYKYIFAVFWQVWACSSKKMSVFCLQKGSLPYCENLCWWGTQHLYFMQLNCLKFEFRNSSVKIGHARCVCVSSSSRTSLTADSLEEGNLILDLPDVMYVWLVMWRWPKAGKLKHMWTSVVD